MSDKRKYVLVTAISSFRIRYAVPLEDITDSDGHVDPLWANDTVVMNEAKEFSQVHLGEAISDNLVIGEGKLLRMFDEENPHLKGWARQQKLEYIQNKQK